jgi:hypothetical protein
MSLQVICKKCYTTRENVVIKQSESAKMSNRLVEYADLHLFVIYIQDRTYLKHRIFYFETLNVPGKKVLTIWIFSTFISFCVGITPKITDLTKLR